LGEVWHPEACHQFFLLNLHPLFERLFPLARWATFPSLLLKLFDLCVTTMDVSVDMTLLAAP